MGRHGGNDARGGTGRTGSVMAAVKHRAGAGVVIGALVVEGRSERARMGAPRLPKMLDADPGATGLAREFAARAEPLWAGGAPCVPRAAITPALGAALKSAYAGGRLVRGLDGATRVLCAEDQGLKHVDRTTGVERGGRVSRLLVLADDGSERFYREVERLLRRNAPRVLALRLSADEHALGRLMFGPDQVARLLLVEHKDAVSAVLLALAAQWRADDLPPSAMPKA